MREAGVDHIIVPPAYEYRTEPQIVPLFQHYMLTGGLPKSRIGKLGIFTTTPDHSVIKEVLEKIIPSYTLSEYQQKTKTFQTKFPHWTKDVSHRQAHLAYAGSRDRMIRNLVKDDMRTMKDTAVDTIICADRSLLYREKMITHAL